MIDMKFGMFNYGVGIANLTAGLITGEWIQISFGFLWIFIGQILINGEEKIREGGGVK